MGERKTFQELEVSDAFLFAALMEDEEICREFLQLVLETNIEPIWVKTERVIGLDRNYRSVRLDVFVDDRKDTIYDLEMQGQKKTNLVKRSRYYQGQMDIADLKPRGDFNKLRKSYVIFICLFDPFGRGRYRYTFEEHCLEEEFPLGDETRKIFLSTEGKNPEEVPVSLVRFLKYVKNAAAVLEEEEGAGDSFIKHVNARVQALKNNSGLEGEYMLFGELLDDERQEGRQEGQKIGETKGRRETKQEINALIAALIKDGKADLLPKLENPEFLDRMMKKYL